MKTLSKFFAISLVISLFPFYGMAENSATQDEGVVIRVVDDCDIEVFEILIIVDDDVVVETIRGWGDDTVIEEGVVINGVRWATRNVDAPGTFAESPESPGMFFQWNRRRGWNAVDEEVENWDRPIPEGTKWYAENDPCPVGWRVPTIDELSSLIDAGSEWTTLNGANGRLFGIAPYQIFLPAVGGRVAGDGFFRSGGGMYWSNKFKYETINAHLLFFNDHNASMGVWISGTGYSVRCVAK